MTLPEKHFRETETLLRKIDKKKISQWLLEQGYYPEQYVVPPSFKVEKFDLLHAPFYPVKSETDSGGKVKYSLSFKVLVMGGISRMVFGLNSGINLFIPA